MADPRPDDDSRARLRGKRLVLGVFLLVASVFVVISAAQIIPAVFGFGARPLATAPETTEGGCAQGIRGLSAALDRAVAQALGARGSVAGWEDKQETMDDAAALAAFRAGLGPEWEHARAVEERCAAEPRGLDAFAALSRLRLAEESFVRRQVVEIAPLRRDVAAYLPH